MIDFQEQKWIDAARKGDQNAFAELVRLYEKKVFALTTRMCKNPDDAAEAAQEAFLAAWQGLPSFRGDSAFSTWLYRLASNACIDLLRREGRHRDAAGPSFNDDDHPVEIPDTAATPQELSERKELREIHQLSYDEIAKILQLDQGTVKSRINRARKQLRKFLLQRGNFSDFASSKSPEEGCK